jgi:hypothetical protein
MVTICLFLIMVTVCLFLIMVTVPLCNLTLMAMLSDYLPITNYNGKVTRYRSSCSASLTR